MRCRREPGVCLNHYNIKTGSFGHTQEKGEEEVSTTKRELLWEKRASRQALELSTRGNGHGRAQRKILENLTGEEGYLWSHRF